MAPQRISACLIVQNEQARLAAALESLAFCDEIIVIDGGSHDRTIEIARAANATVIENPWPGFAAQRNLALDAATTEWVLEVDADERISPTLRASIETLLADPPASINVAIFALRNRFLGGLLGPSAKYPAYRARLFRRGSYRHDESRAVHEGIELRERPAVLDGDLEHELAGSLREALTDAWRYAQLDSLHITPTASAASYVKGIVLRPAAKFAYRMVIDGGWRDGWRGALKISLDAGTDALVWILAFAHRDAAAQEPRANASASEHFGRRRVGPLKVVGVAAGARARRAAIERLGELQRRGADVALISEAPGADLQIPSQTVARVAPIALIRALEAEMHVRPIDTVIAFGRRAELVLRLVPASFRPQIADLDAEEMRG